MSYEGVKARTKVDYRSELSDVAARILGGVPSLQEIDERL